MKTTKLLGKVVEVEGERLVIEVPPFHISKASRITRNQELSIEITEIANQRTSAQNRMMWKLIHEIALEINGRADKAADEEIYQMALERANVKYEFIATLPEAEPMLVKNFRSVKFVQKQGKMNLYKVFIGSSEMTKKEMSELIDTLLDMAVEIGLDYWYWRGVLL